MVKTARLWSKPPTVVKAARSWWSKPSPPDAVKTAAVKTTVVKTAVVKTAQPKLPKGQRTKPPNDQKVKTARW